MICSRIVNRLWDDKNQTVHHIISRYRKLPQKEYKTKHD